MSDLGRLLCNRDFAFYWVGVVVSQEASSGQQAPVSAAVVQPVAVR